LTGWRVSVLPRSAVDSARATAYDNTTRQRNSECNKERYPFTREWKRSLFGIKKGRAFCFLGIKRGITFSE